MLAENRRLSCCREIAQLFEKMRAEHERVADVDVQSAVELSAEQRERFTAALSSASTRECACIRRSIQSLLGGAVVQADDLVIDGSCAAVEPGAAGDAASPELNIFED